MISNARAIEISTLARRRSANKRASSYAIGSPKIRRSVSRSTATSHRCTRRRATAERPRPALASAAQEIRITRRVQCVFTAPARGVTAGAILIVDGAVLGADDTEGAVAVRAREI